MPKNLPIRSAAAVVLLVAISLMVVHRQAQEPQKKEVHLTLQEFILNSFLAELADIQKTLPHKIDQNTTLLSMTYSDQKVFSHYEIDSTAMHFSLDDGLKLGLEAALQNQNCLSDTKRKLLEAGIDFVEQYQKPNGGLIFKLTTQHDDCLRLPHLSTLRLHGSSVSSGQSAD